MSESRASVLRDLAASRRLSFVSFLSLSRNRRKLFRNKLVRMVGLQSSRSSLQNGTIFRLGQMLQKEKTNYARVEGEKSPPNLSSSIHGVTPSRTRKNEFGRSSLRNLAYPGLASPGRRFAATRERTISRGMNGPVISLSRRDGSGSRQFSISRKERT